MKKIIVWKNLNNDTYYYKLVKGCYVKYEVGYKNQYNHEIIIIIDDINFDVYKMPLKKRVLMKLISFLQKINK